MKQRYYFITWNSQGEMFGKRFIGWTPNEAMAHFWMYAGDVEFISIRSN